MNWFIFYYGLPDLFVMASLMLSGTARIDQLFYVIAAGRVLLTQMYLAPAYHSFTGKIFFAFGDFALAAFLFASLGTGYSDYILLFLLRGFLNLSGVQLFSSAAKLSAVSS